MNQKLTNRRSLWLLVLLVLLLAAQLAMIQIGPDATAQAVATTDASTELAYADATGTDGEGAQQSRAAAGTQGASTQDAGVSSTPANATATTAAGIDRSVSRAAFEVRAANVSARTTTKTDARLAAIARQVDANIATQGTRGVAVRLAARYGMSVEELRAEKAASGASWGQMMIAHALAEKAGPPVTAEQLIAMHEDGMGWGRIAAGLGIKLGAAMRDVNASAHAAQGVAKAGWRSSSVRGAGARAGVRGGVSGGVVAANVRGVGGGVGAGMGRGLKLGH